MRPQKIDDPTLLSGLKAVLSLKGYDGASLNDLASSSGLQKASLYHRFPGGKKEIAMAVLQFVGEWVENNIVRILNDYSMSPIDRLKIALEKINELYNEGKTTCILRALSLDSGMKLFSEAIEEATKVWIDSFYQLAIDFGLPKEKAFQTALNVLVKIQGSLVVSKMLHDREIFKDALIEIQEMYMKK